MQEQVTQVTAHKAPPVKLEQVREVSSFVLVLICFGVGLQQVFVGAHFLSFPGGLLLMLAAAFAATVSELSLSAEGGFKVKLRSSTRNK